jgi:putative tryptophan/tyrosine transport system substrate-binding protein
VHRRRFLLTSLAAAVAPTSAIDAQPAEKVYRVGLLSADAPRTQDLAQSAFVKTLRELGWVEGRNLLLEERLATTTEHLDALAAELVRLKVDVIYTGGTPAIRAAKRATSSIPLVMIVGVDPVADGLVASLPRPGGNITGVTALSSDLIEKRLGLLSEVIPRGSPIAYMWNPGNPGNVSAWEQTRKVAPTMRLTVQPAPMSAATELDGAFTRMATQRIGGLLVGADGLLLAQRARLAELALKHRIPAMYSFREHAEAGGLMAYSADWDALRRRAAVFVDKILKGAKPGELPIEQPNTFEFVINRTAARALGLTITPSLLARADQVIE